MLKDLSWEIADAGIRYVFGIPGSGDSLTLIDHLQSYGVECQITHFEGSGAVIAASYGMVSNSLGVVLAIKGPGVANLVPGLAVCSLENIPLIAISEAVSASSTNRTVHKRIDHRYLTSGVTKENLQLDFNSGKSFFKASTIATAETPGPVLLELIDHLDKQKVGKREVKKSETKEYSSAAIDKLLTKIRQSRKPVVIAGSAAYRAGLEGSLRCLTVPIFTTLAAKGLVDESADYSAGIYTGAGKGNAPESRVIANADLVIGIGLRGNELLKFPPFDCPAVNIDFSCVQRSEGHEFIVKVDIENGGEIFFELAKKEWGAELVADSIFRLRSQLLAVDFLPATVLETVSYHLSGACRLVVDTGFFCTVAEHVWRSTRYGEFLCSSNGRYMGTAVPMAIGASIGDSTQPTIIVTGDGGIGMYFSELRIAVERTLPVLVLFFSDGGFGSIRYVAEKRGISGGSLNMKNPSWANLLQALGMDGVVASRLEHVSDGLKSWDKSNGPAFIECRFDPDKYSCMVNNIR
jgi:acetolactate synthase-1/2/3 large subunit